MAVLTVNDLCKTYGAGTPRANRVLDHINFDVRGQTFVSIVGPSGCGKSTLLNIISGVEPHTSGDISVTSDEGKPARLGYVFQDPRLLPWRSVRKNMLYVQDEADEAANRRVDKYLDMVGLGKHGDFWPGQLSGGMQQRVGIARAFAVEPDLLIMDEPFSHLDAITARALREQLQDIWSQSRTSWRRWSSPTGSSCCSPVGGSSRTSPSTCPAPGGSRIPPWPPCRPRSSRDSSA
jgi:NitT/TauT family transport system ATP-binding protein